MSSVHRVGCLRTLADRDNRRRFAKGSLLGTQKQCSRTICFYAAMRLCEISASPSPSFGQDEIDCPETALVVLRAQFEALKFLEDPNLSRWVGCIQGHKIVSRGHGNTRGNGALESHWSSLHSPAVATQPWSRDGGRVRVESSLLNDQSHKV